MPVTENDYIGLLMQTPSSQPVHGQDSSAILGHLSQAGLQSYADQSFVDTSPDNIVREHDRIADSDSPEASRQAEGRRDRLSDRQIGPDAVAQTGQDGNGICITGHSPTGRKFRIRFLQKNVTEEPIARRA